MWLGGRIAGVERSMYFTLTPVSGYGAGPSPPPSRARIHPHPSLPPSRGKGLLPILVSPSRGRDFIVVGLHVFIPLQAWRP